MSQRPRREAPPRTAALVALALAAGTALLSLPLQRLPPALPASAAPESFSAARAMRDVEVLAAQPRPVGSAAHAAAGRYLLARMEALGLAAEIQEATVVRGAGSRLRVARVRNLIGRLEGTGGGGAVLLMAHYDSRPNTPGAGDDASGVAVVLELVRALAATGAPGADLIVLLTDAEELGLLGARGFAAGHAWLEDVAWVLNFEARGARGPAVMFETGAAGGGLVTALATTPRPLASSLGAEVYRRMPNDTDFTVLRGAAKPGLNFAFVGGHVAYHHALDTPQRLQPTSLQHAGDNALALLRRLDSGPPTGGDDAGIFFNPAGWWLLALPAAWALPAALAGVVGVVALAVWGRWRRRTSWRRLGSALLVAATALAAAPLAGAALWKLFADNATGLLDRPHRLPYDVGLTGLALSAAALAVVAALCAMGRPRPPLEWVLGVAGLLAAAAAATAVLAPGAVFLFLWPLWGLVAAGVVVLAADLRPAAATLVATAGALPGVLMLAPTALLTYLALTPHLAVGALAPTALLLVLLLPALGAAAGQRGRLALVAASASLALLAAVVLRGEPTAARPRTASLVHLTALDEGSAFWVSEDERPHAWVRQRLGAAAESWQPPAHLGLGETVLRGAAVAASGEGARVVVVDDVRGEGRRLTLRLGSPAAAPVLWVRAESTVQIGAVEVAGERFERAAEEAAQPLALELAGLPADGIEVTLELSDRWPVELHVTEQFYGLPALPPPPPELIPDSSWRSHSRLVHRSFLL